MSTEATSSIKSPSFNWDGEYNPKHLTAPLSSLPISFSVQTRISWKATAASTLSLSFNLFALCLSAYMLGKYAPKKLGLGGIYAVPLIKQIAENSFLKIAVLPLGIYNLSKYTTQRLIMTCLYPAQSRISRLFFPISEIRELVGQSTQRDQDNSLVFRRVRLEKNGTSYSALLISSPSTKDNRKWALQATGNLEFVEGSFKVLGERYLHYGFNVLMLNGPGVLENGGQATPYTIGEAQEMGIRFLEEGLKAQEIILAGRSLGAAAIGQAILQHKFKETIKYTVISQMTFDRVSAICAQIGSNMFPFFKPSWISRIVKWAGCEMDTVEACTKLNTLSITHMIAQGATYPATNTENFIDDGVIPKETSLGYALIKRGLTEKELICAIYDPGAKNFHMTNDAVFNPLIVLRRNNLI